MPTLARFVTLPLLVASLGFLAACGDNNNNNFSADQQDYLPIAQATIESPPRRRRTQSAHYQL